MFKFIYFILKIYRTVAFDKQIRILYIFYQLFGNSGASKVFQIIRDIFHQGAEKFSTFAYTFWEAENFHCPSKHFLRYFLPTFPPPACTGSNPWSWCTWCSPFLVKLSRTPFYIWSTSGYWSKPTTDATLRARIPWYLLPDRTIKLGDSTGRERVAIARRWFWICSCAIVWCLWLIRRIRSNQMVVTICCQVSESLSYLKIHEWYDFFYVYLIADWFPSIFIYIGCYWIFLSISEQFWTVQHIHWNWTKQYTGFVRDNLIIDSHNRVSLSTLTIIKATSLKLAKSGCSLFFNDSCLIHCRTTET